MKVIKIIFVGILCFGISTFAFATDLFDPTITNLNNDNITNFADFAIMAAHWGKTQANLAGDFDDNNTVDTDDLLIFSWYWLTEYSEYQQCQQTDLDSDGIIALEDLAKFAQNWLVSGEGLLGDFDDSNLVDYRDLYSISDCWLKGSTPQGIFESLKIALAIGDVNKAVSYFADFAADDYREIFNESSDNLQGLANDMGTLSLEYRDKDIAVYELSDANRTNFFPLVFILDDGGQWKIAVF